jgi:hypothetical protein
MIIENISKVFNLPNKRISDLIQEGIITNDHTGTYFKYFRLDPKIEENVTIPQPYIFNVDYLSEIRMVDRYLLENLNLDHKKFVNVERNSYSINGYYPIINIVFDLMTDLEKISIDELKKELIKYNKLIT